MAKQTALFRGIYEFEDPSGCLIAAQVPQEGSVDLYSGTRILVRPNQVALFFYDGKSADVLPPGNHEVKTENFPILTRLANWRFGFKSPLRAEIWFFSNQIFTGRRWGTASPVMANVETLGTIPVRGYGNYNIRLRDPKAFHQHLAGTRSSFDIAELDEFVQGQILEILPQTLRKIREARDLSLKQDEISKDLERLLNEKLRGWGLEAVQTQVLSLLPPEQILKAIDERLAMNIIGDPREYLLYKMAGSVDQLKGQAGSNDPGQLMMSLMLTKGLIGADYHDQEKKRALPAGSPGLACTKCKAVLPAGSRFCSQCGAKAGP